MNKSRVEIINEAIKETQKQYDLAIKTQNLWKKYEMRQLLEDLIVLRDRSDYEV